MEPHICRKHNFSLQYLWVHIIVIALAGISLVLNIRYMLEIGSILTKVKNIIIGNKNKKKIGLLEHPQALSYLSQTPRAHTDSINTSKSSSDEDEYQKLAKMRNREEDKSLYLSMLIENRNNELLNWDQISFMDKTKLFNWWAFVMIMANLFEIFGSLFFIFRKFLDPYIASMVLGVGAFLVWSALMQYVQTSKAFSSVQRSFSKSLFLITTTIVGVLPFMIGYALLGMCLFIDDNKFKSFSNSFFTLFALMNGDVVFDTYHEVRQFHFILGALYVYFYIFFAICMI
jgi:hypothetical protein